MIKHGMVLSVILGGYVALMGLIWLLTAPHPQRVGTIHYPLFVDLDCKVGLCLSGGFAPGPKTVKTITVHVPVSGVI